MIRNFELHLGNKVFPGVVVEFKPNRAHREDKREPTHFFKFEPTAALVDLVGPDIHGSIAFTAYENGRNVGPFIVARWTRANGQAKASGSGAWYGPLPASEMESEAPSAA